MTISAPVDLRGKTLWFVIQVAGAEAPPVGGVELVACKRVAPVLAGLFSREGYPHQDMEPLAAESLDAFGADSLVPGSDYPLLETSNYAESMSLAQRLIQMGNTRGTCRFASSIFGKLDPIKE
jgi:hypothetical protein